MLLTRQSTAYQIRGNVADLVRALFLMRLAPVYAGRIKEAFSQPVLRASLLRGLRMGQVLNLKSILECY